MKSLTVNLTGKDYDILIGKSLLSSIGTLIKERFSPNKIVIVTDDTVNELYGNNVVENLQSEQFTVKLISLTPGEQAKSLDNLSFLYNEILSFGFTRSDLVIALGGGVIGDLTGFLAATLLRGVPFIQVPTTLLAQVDSSVGGKVAVNVPTGKNLVGAFYQPKLVIIDTNTLDTLSDRIFFDGLAEVIKYGLIQDKALFDKFNVFQSRADICKEIDDIIYRCCDIKRTIVEQDEFDTGLRMLLNFGHTIGHIVEKQYNFSTYTHGQAVAFGMCAISKMGELMGITPAGTASIIENIVQKFNLPTFIELKSEMKNTLGLDKKSQGTNIHIVLLDQIGNALTKKISIDDFIRQFNKISL